MYVWDRHDGSLVEQRRVIDGPIGDISYTPDGSGLVVGARSGVILQLGAEDLTGVAPGIDLGSSIRGVIQNPDGRRVLVLFNESTDLAMVDLTDGAVVYEADPGIALNWADFSPDGSLIAVAASPARSGSSTPPPACGSSPRRSLTMTSPYACPSRRTVRRSSRQV